MQTDKMLITLEELSILIGMPKATIYTKKCRGEFPKGSVVKLGRKVMFKKEAILQWIDSCVEDTLIPHC